jgi:hypothetical protein
MKEVLLNLIKAQNKMEESYFSFLKYLSTLSIGFLGLFIGLKPIEFPNYYSDFFFFITILFISLSTIFLSVCIYYETKNSRKETEIRKNLVLKYIENPIDNKFQIETYENKHERIFEFITYSLLILSLVLVCIYVFFSTLY